MQNGEHTSLVAVVQHPPVYLNRATTLERAVALVGEAASAGAKLVAFPESFVPSYPDHVGRLRPVNHLPLVEALYASMMANEVDLAADDLKPLREAARDHDVTIVCGITERDAAFSRSTMYNSAVVGGPNGAILNRHRKLMPTNAERMVWGLGDASGARRGDSERPRGRADLF